MIENENGLLFLPNFMWNFFSQIGSMTLPEGSKIFFKITFDSMMNGQLATWLHASVQTKSWTGNSAAMC